MESFLTSAEKRANTEYALVEYYILCMTNIVELQFGEKVLLGSNIKTDPYKDKI